MSEEQKQSLLDAIKTQHGINVLMGQPVNANMLRYIKGLLTEE